MIGFCGRTLQSGADPGFFLGRGALVSCSSSTAISLVVFFRRIPVVLENRRSSQGRVRIPCTLPLDPPLTIAWHKKKKLESGRIKSPINVAGWILGKLVPVFAFL